MSNEVSVFIRKVPALVLMIAGFAFLRLGNTLFADSPFGFLLALTGAGLAFYSAFRGIQWAIRGPAYKGVKEKWWHRLNSVLRVIAGIGVVFFMLSLDEGEIADVLAKGNAESLLAAFFLVIFFFLAFMACEIVYRTILYIAVGGAGRNVERK